MTTKPKAVGFKIVDVRLVSGLIRWIDPVAQRMDREPASSEAGLNIEHDLESAATPAEPGYGPFTVDLTLRVRGTRNEIPEWEAEARYRGTFELFEGSTLKPEAARSINGPAVLYSFAREFIYDLARRADAGKVLLPALQFSPVPPKK